MNEHEVLPHEDPIAIEIKKENIEYAKSQKKKKKIEKLVVNQHNVPYSGDDISQNRMGNTLAIANWKFNESIGNVFLQQSGAMPEGHPAKELFSGLGAVFNGLYKGIYKDTKLDWKGADKTMHHVEAESIGEALYSVMVEVGKEIKKTTKDEK